MFKRGLVSISMSFLTCIAGTPAEGAQSPEPVTVGEQTTDASPCEPSSPPRASLEQDVRCWRTIVNSTKSTDFKGYLRHFPEGVFRALAISRLNALLAEEAPNPRREQAGCFYCSPGGMFRLEPTFIVPRGRYAIATDAADEGEIDGFAGNPGLQLAGVDFALRRPRWFKVGLNGDLGIGQYEKHGLFAVSWAGFVQFREYRIEVGKMYLRSANPELTSTQRDRKVTFIGISFPGLSDKIKQLMSR